MSEHESEYVIAALLGEQPPRGRFKDAYRRAAEGRPPANKAELVGQILGRLVVASGVAGVLLLLGAPAWGAVGLAWLAVRRGWR